MSSDSEDIDEDELLQMALKEQAQRDLNYQKPSSLNSRKPVANYVQPPPQPPLPSKKVSVSQNSQMPKPRRQVDDDDDSEVELLSISSGDDESTDRDHVRSGAVGSRARAGAGKAVGKDDDLAWDGDEPDRWKRVDDAEVTILFHFFFFGLMIMSSFRSMVRICIFGDTFGSSR